MNPFRHLRPVPDAPSPSVPTHDDAHLLEAAARGDQQAFATLYDRLAALVHGITVRVVRDPSIAEEVTQEVFVELWRVADRFEATSGSVRGFVATIAHRRAVDRVRSEQSSRTRDDKVARLEPTEADSVASDVEDSLERERVRRALDQLSPLQRQTVELAYYGGHTYREVARLLDLPEGTVKTRIRDGLIRLRDNLGTAP
ncbi:MAG: ECF RNA polymerase sigma factor SigK [Acidimicrobiales bacterium]